MKKILKGTAVVIICVLFSLTIFAARDVSHENDMAADLRELGLFSGVSANNFDLERAPTRVEVLVMLIRVLGEEDEAVGGTWTHPFTDVPTWADPYVGYAYQNELTQGISATKFGTGTAGAGTYLTFMLRALGYSDENGLDFTWDKPYDLAKEIGILPDFVDTTTFWRADIVTISYAALDANLKGSTMTLADKLIAAGTFTTEAYREYYHKDKLTVSAPSTPSTPSASGALTSTEIYNKCSPAVFFIGCYDKAGNLFASGSGFFISDSGIAVTNHHVLEDADRAVAVLAGANEAFEIVGVYDYDEEGDWAVIQVDSNSRKFPYLEISTDALIGGENIFTIGSPEGLENTISTGLISNPSRYIGSVEYIQISAPISHGSSGGALINDSGKVIGITSAGYEEGQNLNFARPISCIANADTSSFHMLPIGGDVASSISYNISNKNVTVAENDTVTITFSSVENVPSDASVTYTIEESDDSIFNAAWGDEEDQPWSINITGYKAGTATLKIYNDYTSDVEYVNVTVTASAKPASIEYSTTANSVSVTAGSTSTFYLTTTENGVPEDFDLSYYISSTDKNVATVAWGDEEYQPWGIIVTGVAPGTAYVHIRNNYNGAVIDIPVTVTAPAKTDAWNTLKSELIRNGEYDSKYQTYDMSYTTSQIYLNVSYDAEYDTISIGALFSLDDSDVYVYLIIDDSYSVYLGCSLESDSGETIEGSGFINPKTFNSSTVFTLSDFDGPRGSESDFAQLASVAAVNALKMYDAAFNLSVKSSDLGFKSIY